MINLVGIFEDQIWNFYKFMKPKLKDSNDLNFIRHNISKYMIGIIKLLSQIYQTLLSELHTNPSSQSRNKQWVFQQNGTKNYV